MGAVEGQSHCLVGTARSQREGEAETAGAGVACSDDTALRVLESAHSPLQLFSRTVHVRPAIAVPRLLCAMWDAGHSNASFCTRPRRGTLDGG